MAWNKVLTPIQLQSHYHEAMVTQWYYPDVPCRDWNGKIISNHAISVYVSTENLLRIDMH